MPRIAWDGPYATWPKVRNAVRMLKRVGYGRKDIFVFMILQSPLVVYGDAQEVGRMPSLASPGNRRRIGPSPSSKTIIGQGHSRSLLENTTFTTVGPTLRYALFVSGASPKHCSSA